MLDKGISSFIQNNVLSVIIILRGLLFIKWEESFS